MALPPEITTVAQAITHFTQRDASRETRLKTLEAKNQAPIAAKTSDGRLYRGDGTTNGMFNADATWTSVERPALIPFAPSPVIAAQTAGGSASDAGGIREGYLYEDADGTWYVFYGAGSGISNGQGTSTSPWRPQYRKSIDRGLTWTAPAEVEGVGLRHGYDGGTWPARDMLFVYKHTDGFYYLHTLTAGDVGESQVCYPPYTSDVWKASKPQGPYTFVRATLNSAGAGQFDGRDAYSSCLVEQNGIYHNFYSATPGDGRNWFVGRATSTSPDGPFQRTGSAVLRPEFVGDENPEVFWHPVLNKWVMMTNYVNLSLGLTDRNHVYFSDKLDDWSEATFHITQRVSPIDGNIAIGHARPKRKAPYTVDLDAAGNVPTIFDTDPPPTSNGAHTGRRLKYAVMEPSRRALAITLAGPASYSAPPTTDFGDDFSTENTGDLGGQNGWTDVSGTSPKPQIAGSTGARYIDMQSSVGPSAVARLGKTYKDHRQKASITVGENSGIGTMIGFKSLMEAHLRVDYGAHGTYIIFVPANGGAEVALVGGFPLALVQGVATDIETVVSGYTIGASVNGKIILSFSLKDAAHKAVIDAGGGVGLRNGAGGTGQRRVRNYAVLLDTPASSAADFSDTFQTETVGDLGGQNGWVDFSGANAKPQIAGAAGSRYLDMRTSVGASIVARTDKSYANQVQKANITIGTDSAIGVMIGYTGLNAAYLRVEFSAFGTLIYYVAASGTETELASNTAPPLNTAFDAEVTVSGYTITGKVNGVAVVAFTANTAAHKAVIDAGGGVGLRNGAPGTGQRRVSSYSVGTLSTTPAQSSAPLYLTAAHTDIVVEAAITPSTLGGTLNLFYRLAAGGSVQDGYRIALDLTGNNVMATGAYKVVAGAPTQLASTASGAKIKAVANTYNRVSVSVIGNLHTISVDGEAQLSFTDSSFTSGAGIALQAVNTSGMNARVRSLTVRKSNTVVVNNVSPGQVVTLRGAGGIPLASVTASSTSAALTAPHYPATSIDVAGVPRYAVVDGIWGGDVFS